MGKNCIYTLIYHDFSFVNTALWTQIIYEGALVSIHFFFLKIKHLTNLLHDRGNFCFIEIVRENKEHCLSQYAKALMKQEGPKHLFDHPRTMYD